MGFKDMVAADIAASFLNDDFFGEPYRVEGKTILIASHAAAIRSFWCRISEIPPEEVAERVQFPTNASFTTVYFDGERLIPHEYSNDKHFSSDNS